MPQPEPTPAPAPRADRVYVLPGEMTVARRPTEVATLLGSCVAVCLHARTSRSGGLCHYLLGDAPAAQAPSDTGRYGTLAVPALVKLVRAIEGSLVTIDASIVGGAAVVEHLTSGAGIGARNVEVARRLVRSAGLRLVAEDVGGERGRKVRFDTASGELEVRPIERSEATEVRARRAAETRGRRLRAVVVDDSAAIRRLIAAALEADPGIEVVGEAADAYAARAAVLELEPDVLTLDVIMPGLDGLQFLRRLMAARPMPVVVVSTIAQRGSKVREQLLAAGAAAVVDKAELDLHRGSAVATSVLAQRLKAAYAGGAPGARARAG